MTLIARHILSLAAFCAVQSCATRDGPETLWSASGADSVVSTHDVQCGETTYLVGYRFGERQGSERGLHLAVFERAPVQISEGLSSALAAEFSKFNNASFIEFSCGETKLDEPAQFLAVEIRGSYRHSIREAYERCRAKGWTFDFDTHRTFRIEEIQLLVDGDEIGYCHGNSSYFELDLDNDETEPE